MVHKLSVVDFHLKSPTEGKKFGTFLEPWNTYYRTHEDQITVVTDMDNHKVILSANVFKATMCLFPS